MFSGLLVLAIFAAITIGVWAWANRPNAEPAWPNMIQGVAFSPYQESQNAYLRQYPTDTEIDSDLALLAPHVHAVRTYSTSGTLGDIPDLAARHGMSVSVGAWLDKDLAVNEEEIARAITLAKTNRNVVRVFVGNEVLLRGDLSVTDLAAYLDRVRKAVRQPVGTAETWSTWLKYPELASHVDFIAIHLLPYWEGLDVDSAVDFCIRSLQLVQARFPGKPVIIGEVGWPSDGRTRQSAVASPANEALFLRRFLAQAEKKEYRYYVMEAFDQPWKAAGEGGVGAYWGIYDVHRQAKFEFVQPIVRIPDWRLLAGLSVGLAALLLLVFYQHSGALKNRGRTLLALVVYAAATVMVWVIYDYSQQYITPATVIVGAVLILGMLGVIAVLFAEAHEWAEAHWARAHQRLLVPQKHDRSYTPKVTVQVPAYNEPPEMMIETLDALAQLDYPNFEVLVIDNNTRDEAVWRPVEAHCAKLGERFRFFHVAPLAGFKAGALNFAQAHTASDSEIIAVIDSDYRVEPNWLSDLVPSFQNPRIGIVQAPQDYRDEGENAFKAMCFAEYRGFFYIGMITRNERNAIIQHGTMTLVRRTLLDSLGGWSEWCITEDAELGIRVFEAGFEALYLPKSYGRGLMPDTFLDYKKQRFRWAYGAMQILKSHAASILLPSHSTLTAGQRYHFVAGWLPWVADGVNLLFNLAAIAWSVAMVRYPDKVDPPLMIFSLLPLSLFLFKLIKLVHLYVYRVGVNFRQTCAAALAGLALSHTIGRATLKGLVTRSMPFFRTPKRAQASAILSALGAAREEFIIMLGLWVSAIGVRLIPTEVASPDLSMWIIALLIQSTPYFAAVCVSLISALHLPAKLLHQGPPATDDAAPAPV